jgi:hypothetical protein
MTLCEANMGIDPEFNLWNYFFHVWHLEDLNTELTVFERMIIHVKSGHGVDPYFNIPIPGTTKGWRKKWFYLRNDVSAFKKARTRACQQKWGHPHRVSEEWAPHPRKLALEHVYSHRLGMCVCV